MKREKTMRIHPSETIEKYTQSKHHTSAFRTLLAHVDTQNYTMNL